MPVSAKEVLEVYGAQGDIGRKLMRSVTPEQAKAISKAARIIEGMSGRAGHDAVDKLLEKANRLFDGHGVEAIMGDSYGGYYQSVRLLYVNQGDPYTATLCYDTDKGNFFFGAWGDWVEHMGSRYGIE
jgi:hypothetical protein